MNKKVLRYIISLMIISFLGIISFQAYWIWIKVNDKAAEFDQRIYRSLAQIKENLGEREALVFVQNIQENNHTETTTSKAERVVHNYFNEDDEQTEIVVSGNEEFTYEILVDGSGNKINSKYKVFQTKPNIKLETIIQQDSNTYLPQKSKNISNSKKEKDLIRIYTNKKDKLETVVRKLAFDFAFKNEPLNFRIKKLNLDSTISESLKSEGILTNDYSYYVVDKETDSIIVNSSKEEIKSSKNVFKTAILENSESQNGGILNIAFENKTNFILKSIWLSLLISVVLILIMIFTFSYTIHAILKEKKLSRIKADFINNMTHEFKTPIATISLAVDSILHPMVKENTKEIERFGEIIKKENERMNRQIESVLNAARFEKQVFELKQEKINLNQLISELAQDFKLKINSQSGNIKLNLTKDPIFIIGDQMHFYNVIRNLIDNSIKFSKSDFRVTITTSKTNGLISIKVSDQGIGMDKETKKYAFNRFYRKSEGNLHTTKGFGLGLNYVHEIISRMNGEIKLNSELGKGTEVIIKLKSA